jgi:hypothetical protein
MNANQTLRYEIGKKYYFIDVLWGRPDTAAACTLDYLPGIDTLYQIIIIELICVEHHKVPWVHDTHGVRNYDGFIFERENDDTKWHNQYPYASYHLTAGSLSSDWSVTRASDTVRRVRNGSLHESKIHSPQYVDVTKYVDAAHSRVAGSNGNWLICAEELLTSINKILKHYGVRLVNDNVDDSGAKHKVVIDQ